MYVLLEFDVACNCLSSCMYVCLEIMPQITVLEVDDWTNSNQTEHPPDRVLHTALAIAIAKLKMFNYEHGF